MRTIGIAVLVIFVAGISSAEDREWVDAVERAQRARPAVIGSIGRIAPAGEPGTPLVIHGRVLRGDGRTPAPDIVVFGYQTDNTGFYNHPPRPHVWRLKGWARTDRDGRFVMHTIRPAPYPGRRIPAHVHLFLDGPDLPRRWIDELRFLDDAFLTEEEKRASMARGAFGSVRPVETRGGVQHVTLNIRISEEGKF